MNYYKKSTGNSILERIHQVIGSMLKTKYLVNVMFDAVASWSDITSYIAYAVQCSYHSTLQDTPGQLFFGHDMLLDINFKPNYKDMWLRKKKLINYNNNHENKKRL